MSLYKPNDAKREVLLPSQHGNAMLDGWRKQRSLVLQKQDELQQQLAGLNRLINATVFINTLPVELLVEIFACVRAHIILSSLTHKRAVASQWMVIPGVCRHWRGVVNATPMFWRTIDVYTSPDWLSLSLSRCARARADVYFHDQNFPSPRLEILWANAERIRTIDFADLCPEHNEPLIQLFSMPLPSLETLRLYQYVIGAFWEDLGLVSSRVPQLKSLSLQVYHPPRDKALYANLRSLEIRTARRIKKSAWTVTLHQFLDLLEAAERLEQLTLDDCFSLENAADELEGPPRNPPATLSTLRSFNVTGHPPGTTRNLLQHIRIPHPCNVCIKCSVSPARAVSEVTESIGGVLPRDKLSLFPWLSTVTSVEATAENDSYELSARTPSDHTITIALATPVQPFSWDWSVAFSRLLGDLTEVFADVTSLRELELRGNYSLVSGSTWSALFNNVNSLETLILSGTGHPATMWESLSCAPVGRHEGKPCRYLKCIKTPGEEHCIYAADFFNGGGAILILRSRFRQNVPLERLDVRLHRFDDNGVESLSEWELNYFRDACKKLVRDVTITFC